jgi:H+-transporting ATPase
VATGEAESLSLVGLIALSDPPNEDSAGRIDELRRMGVRTVMVTGDSPETAATIAGKVGIDGVVCSPDELSDERRADSCGVFARVVPEEKHRIVKALQGRGHVVGMCGDGVNDAPALRQAQMGIAVASATDVAKTAAGVVLTEPGLAGIVHAVRGGRIAFQRLRTYTFNMLVKKTEIVLFLAIGLLMTGHAVLTPTLLVLMFMSNDILAMSLTTDRASVAPMPSAWRITNITAAGVVIGVCKLGFSVGILAIGKFQLRLGPDQLQTLAFVTLVFGSQATVYVLRERRRLWNSTPSGWVLLASGLDFVVVSTLALSGVLMAPLAASVLATVLIASIGLAFVLDQIKRPVLAVFKVP